MTTPCIHGFPNEQCVSCRTCEHGLAFSSCGRCRVPVTTRKIVEPSGDRTTHEHAGYEIFYEPAVTGWRYRGPDATASRLSYRSAFLARKAVDLRAAGIDDDPQPAARKKGGKKAARTSGS